MRRRQEVRLHSPISEGEEGPRGSSVAFSSTEEEEISAIISHRGCHDGLASAGASCPSDLTRLQLRSGLAGRVATDSSPTCSNIHIPVQAAGTGSAGGESALHTQNQTRTKPAGLEPDAGPTADIPCVGEKDPDWPAACLDTSTEKQGGQPEPSVCETPPPEAGSVWEPQTPSPSADALLFPLTVEAQKTYMCLSDTDTSPNPNAHLAYASAASDTLACFDGTDMCSQHCGRGHEESHAPWSSSGTEMSGQAAWWHERVLGGGASRIEPREEPPRLDEETLHVESVRMVDNILRNALAALEGIDASDRETERLPSGELNEGAETVVLPGDAVEGAVGLQRTPREHLPAQTDGSAQVGPSDKFLGGQVQTDGSRSTPSSGYESIAGSDTDIQSSAGTNVDTTLASGPIGSEQELRERARIGCCSNNTELCMEGSSVCQQNGRGSLHSSTLLLGANREKGEGHKEGEGSVSTEAINELLFQYALSDSNISHNTNITSVQSAISESLSGVNNEQVQCTLVDPGPQYAAKDNPERNKHDLALDLDSGDVSPLISRRNVSRWAETINDSLTGVESCDSEQPDLSNEVRDPSGKEDRLSPPACLSHGVDEVTPPRPVVGEGLTEPKLVSQGLQTYLVEDVPDSETGERETVPASPGPTRPLGSEALASCDTAAKPFLCSITVDQSETHEPDVSAGLCTERAGSRMATLSTAVRTLPDLPGSSGRLHAAEPHHGPRGFAVISEEEETDSVFVNDTGPTLSPGARRARAYPFSLSPIYEEDSGREDCSREEALHVPPATGEEQRSVEQQASSVLSLLQSVSERLLSSALDGPEEGEEEVGERPGGEEEAGGMLWPPHAPRPLWERYDNDFDAVEEETTPLHHQLMGAGVFRAGVSEEGGLLVSGPVQDPTRGWRVQAQGRHGNCARDGAVKTADAPFYQYLRSSNTLALDPEKPLLHHSEGSLTSTTVKETGGVRKINPRPTLLHVSEGPSGGGRLREVYEDMEDAHQVLLPHGGTIRALRGCWLLYAQPGFRGSCVLLEEGQNFRSSSRVSGESGPSPPLSVGSFRRAVKDDSIPEIHVRLDKTRQREPLVLYSEAERVDAGGPLLLSDLSVWSGCWLAYDGAGFTGNGTLLQAGWSPTPLAGDSSISRVRSLRPLRMGGLRVRRPLDPKMVVYEKPLFQGQWKELMENTPRLGDGLMQIASLRITGGLWVGYSCESYTGQQCVLEEGEFSDCTALFSGPELTLKSCRFLQADFIEPAVCLRSSEEQLDILDDDVADLQLRALMEGPDTTHVRPDTTHVRPDTTHVRPDTIHVRSGVWVAYSGRSYTGQQCVLEKGHHSGTLDWGGSQSSPLSLRPVRKEHYGEKEPKFLLRVYSQPGFAGESREFESELADCAALSPASFRVILGSWLLFDDEGYSGNQFVVGEGLYPHLPSCGCSSTTIRSFRPVPYTFSEPFITLYSLSSFEGLETLVDSPMESMDSFFTQSLRVNSGTWVVYEFSRFKGRQMLLQTGECPCWGDRSGWDTVGSLHPLRQRRAYLHVRSRALGAALTAETGPGSSSPARLSLQSADRTLDTQHWVYGQSLVRSRVDKTCLSVIGAKASVGARVALWNQHGRTHQKWSLNEDGTISSHLNHNLVLERRGGTGLDKDHLVLSEFCAGKASQYWDIEVL